MQLTSMPMVHQHQLSSSESPALVEQLLNEARSDRAATEARVEQQQADLKAALEQQKQETEQQRKAMETKIAELTPGPPSAAITDEQLAALQARIEGLHVTKLLTDDELFALEDLIADYVELTMSVTDHIITRDMIYSMPTVAVASKLDKLVGLSAAMAGDAAFARQARRKFL